ncbi:YcxB family protein [Leptospira venezuelensis]|uniref:YcxB family protein n=1 Tax=Leptospira venezuelensis TaxID=1958811 RepID=UPI000A3A7F4A|nr:YcxB family protein [Leptospira venezuelensis]
MKEIKLIFTPTLEEILDASYRLFVRMEFYKSQIKGRPTRIKIYVALFFFVLLLIYVSPNNTFVYILLSVTILGSIYEYFYPRLAKRNLIKAVKMENPQLSSEEITLSSDGIVAKHKDHTSKYSWNDLSDIKVNDSDIEIYFAKKGLVILRKRFLNHPSEFKAIIDICNLALSDQKKTLFSN